MKLMGFSFNKINIEKKETIVKPEKVNSEIKIQEIDKIKDSPFKTKEELISISFDYNIYYQPDLVELNFKGNMVLSLDSKISNDVLKQWEKKEVPEDFRISVYNIILRKCNIKALQYEDELGIPLHFNLPTVKKEQK